MSQKFVLPKSTLQNADPSYLQRINKLRRVINRINIKSTKSDQYKEKIAEVWKNFGENYLISPDIMDAFMNAGGYYWSINFNPRYEYHLFYHKRKDDWHKNIVEKLKSPHLNIDQTWKEYELNSNNFPPVNIQKTYKELKIFYSKLNSIKNNIFAWFYLLLERNDEEFFIDNVEYRIYKEFANKMLWKLYIKYWKHRNTEKMLHLYSKYCRLFLKDNLMKKKYEKEVEKYGKPFSVPWVNPYSFEVYDKNFLVENDDDTKTGISNESKEIKNMNEITVNATVKTLPFRKTLIDYIIKNANLYLQHKLQKTCKYFQSKFPHFICYQFFVEKDFSKIQNIIPYSTTVSNEHLQLKNLKKISISTIFKINRNSWSTKRNILSSMIPRVAQCTAKYVYIHHQDFSYEDMKLLIGHGNVVNLGLHDVNIYNKDKSKVPLENIFELLPKIREISYSLQNSTSTTIHTTHKTFEVLLNISFENKIDSLYLRCIALDNFNSNFFMEFLKKNVSSVCEICIDFKLQYHNNFHEENDRTLAIFNSIKTFLIDGINSFWTSEHRPSLHCWNHW